MAVQTTVPAGVGGEDRAARSESTRTEVITPPSITATGVSPIQT